MSHLTSELHDSGLLKNAEYLGALAPASKCEPLGRAAVMKAMESAAFPGGRAHPVFDLVNPGESVCIVVSDQTRRTAADLVLPVLFEGLRARGCSLRDMFILVASGIHRHPDTAELEHIVGPAIMEAFEGRIYRHDPDNISELASAGRLRSGREVFIHRRALEADRLILTGAACYHYHAGFGGGRKSIVPGIAARETIAFTHSLTLDPAADALRPGVEIGVLEGNPVAAAMLECARLCPPDFIVNTVVAPDGALAGVFAGEMDSAHRAACGLVEKICRADIAEEADFAIASAGTASNWIQAHKAFFNAHRAVHARGRVILQAKCPEGVGNERFRFWVRKKSPAQICAGLRASPEVLGQTALSTVARAPRTVLVTGMSAADAADLGMRSAPSVEEALRIVLDDLHSCGIVRPKYYVLPDAMYVVPFRR